MTAEVRMLGLWLPLALAAPIDGTTLVQVDTAADQVTLILDPRGGYTSVTVSRRPLGLEAEGWFGAQVVASLDGAVTSWTDPDVVPGEAWEYKVRRSPAGSYGSADAYVLAGIAVPVVDVRGTVVLLVDATHAEALDAQLARLESDLVGDGWGVARHDVPATEGPAEVRARIQAEAAERGDVDAVLIVGHVAVPYSGALNPDGHPDHLGAWPADAYYADLDGNWTDVSVSVTSGRERNTNQPGDGKFDQSLLPSDLELQVGRVDFYDMPAFAPLTEVDLLRRYLDKDHAWRHGEVATERRALVDDNFGDYAPAAVSAWLLAPLVGIDTVQAGDWLDDLTVGEPWLWAFGSGGGSFVSAGGIGRTSDFAGAPLYATFTMLFGSYFGDWDVTDNLMRAALATEGHVLSVSWAGRPNWTHHVMGLGGTLGEAARYSQNWRESITYYGARFVHTGLLGDPTLRAYPVAPAWDVAGEDLGYGDVALDWAASDDPELVGYHVYRALDPAGPFERVTDEPLVEAGWDGHVSEEGVWIWQVRAVALRTTPSGSFFEAAQAAFLELDVDCGGGPCEPPSGDSGDSGVEPPGGCACTSSGGAAAGWLGLIALALVGRRRVSRARTRTGS